MIRSYNIIVLYLIILNQLKQNLVKLKIFCFRQVFVLEGVIVWYSFFS